jgi:hypothetical protein
MGRSAKRWATCSIGAVPDHAKRRAYATHAAKTQHIEEKQLELYESHA